MTATLYAYGDDAEPCERVPAGRLLYVPVRPAAHGCAVRLFRTPVGRRTAVAFTTPDRLRAVLGAGHACAPLAVPALRALVAPLGVDALIVDPMLTAPAPASMSMSVSASTPAQAQASASASAPAPAEATRPALPTWPAWSAWSAAALAR
ncbi:SAV_915 family protein [Streptomyces sp. NPDC046203]|uniref:SAV_915 family protein n=1 Tax=Streptomyces sp. NPDC046203 TaxID=3154602 RepID=UPI0033CF3CD7